MMPGAFPQQMADWPTFRESVDNAVSAENLKEVASKNSDPQVLLGLAFLARAGSPVRQVISELAVEAKPEYAPIIAVLAVTMDGVNETSVGELIQRDPDNALGYYLQGNLLYQGGKENEALEAFRKAAHCSELRFYESTTGDALFKALDALNLNGRERLCALSWMESRLSGFRGIHLQPVNWALSELAQSAAMAVREEISDLLLVLAGQLFVTNFQNRRFGQRALESAFALKAEVAAAENPAKMNGYAATIHAFHSVWSHWPGIDEGVKPKPLQLAQYLPSGIHRAFAMIDPSKRKMLGELNVNPPDSDRPTFEKAMENLIKAAEALLDLALTDPDGILGPYLKGIPPSRKQPARLCVSWSTPVGGLMLKRPDVFRAAAAYEEATHAVWKAGENDPWYKNQRRMMEINLGLHSYAAEHEHTFPESIEVLFEKGHLKPPLEAKSLVTGRPYVYVAAGEKRPVKSRDCFELVLLYDDHAGEHGCHPCVFASGVGGAIRSEDLKEQLRKRGKT